MMAWDPENRCFKMVWADNVGGCGHSPAWLTKDGKLVSTWSSLYRGRPTAMRMIMEFDSSGSIPRRVDALDRRHGSTCAVLRGQVQKAELALRSAGYIAPMIIHATRLFAALLIATPALAQSKQDQRVARQVAAASNRFGFDLYKGVAKTPGNLFFSPYSISAALAMTRTGARGKTATEMDAVLHTGDLDVLASHPKLAELLVSKRFVMDRSGKRFKKPSHELQIANALWGQQGMPFEASVPRRPRREVRCAAAAARLRETRRRAGPDQRLGRGTDEEADPGDRAPRTPQARHPARPRQRDLLQGGLGG